MVLSANFHLGEFACHSGDDVPDELLPNVMNLVTHVLQPIRTFWNRPLVIVSGYRTKAWNDKVGGAKSSTHMTGEGVDLRPVKLTDVPFLHDTILAMHSRGELEGLGGLGIYRNWVHVDTHKLPGGRLRRWSGKGVGSEQ